MWAGSHVVSNTTQKIAVAVEAANVWSRVLRIAFAALVLVYLLRFAAPGLEAGFNGDDPMNIHSFWSRGVGQLARNLVLFFTTYGRPMGGVYFSVLYHFFGLNALPYHIVLLLLIIVNTFLAYRFGRLISGSELTGGLTALVAAYHAHMAPIVYLPAYVFDVLCFTFYFLAFTYYVSRRNVGVPLTRRQTGAFLLLYICALDSKEMAITLPVMILIYEAIWHRPASLSFPALARWLRSEALPALIAGAMTLVYVLGKAFGSDSLTKMEAYRPEFTWGRYWESTTRFVNEILYMPNNNVFGPASVFALALALLCLAWLSRKKHLLLMWFFLWIGPLPITFVPGRGGPCLYLPLMGWAVVVVTLFLWLSSALAGSRLWMAALVLFGMWQLWGWTERQDGFVGPGIKKPGQLTWSVVEQVRALQPSVKPGSRIYVVRGPFPDWEMKFIIELVYHDRTVNVWLGEKVPLPPEEIRKMDYVFTWEGDRLVRLKGL